MFNEHYYNTVPLLSGTRDGLITLSSATAAFGVSKENFGLQSGNVYITLSTVTGSATGFRPTLYQSYDNNQWFVNKQFGLFTSSAFSSVFPVSDLGKYLRLNYAITATRLSSSGGGEDTSEGRVTGRVFFEYNIPYDRSS